jgi:hypothetical protein
VIFSATACEQKNALARAIQRLARKLPRDRDSVAEQGGLEPSVSREVFVRENPREHWKNFAPKSANNVVQRMSSPSVRFGGGRQPWIPVSRESAWGDEIWAPQTRVFQER